MIAVQDINSQSPIIAHALRAYDAWERDRLHVRYALFDIPELCIDPKEIAYLFELYIRECGLKCTGIRQPLRLTTNCALRPKRIDQWDYG